MLNFLYRRFRKRLFDESAHDPEIAHDKVLKHLRTLQRHPLALATLRLLNIYSSPRLKQKLWGLSFPNPIGLAAGFDKNCEVLAAMSAFGFGFLEGGGVVPRAQQGNPRPRTRRRGATHDLLNRMGFNSAGVEAVKTKLAIMPRLPVPVGVNIGVNKDTPLEQAHEDYIHVLQQLYLLADYFVINVSSPNTPGLRDLQQDRYFGQLLRAVATEGRNLADKHNLVESKPILCKIAPDVSETQLAMMLAAIEEAGIAGVILGNSQQVMEDGLTWGLSGPSIFPRAEAMVRFAAKHTQDRLVIIACGGIDCGEKAARMLDQGARLIQILTALFYSPTLALAKEISASLDHSLLRRKSELMH